VASSILPPPGRTFARGVLSRAGRRPTELPHFRRRCHMSGRADGSHVAAKCQEAKLMRTVEKILVGEVSRLGHHDDAILPWSLRREDEVRELGNGGRATAAVERRACGATRFAEDSTSSTQG
jgi:hypothetical protein